MAVAAEVAGVPAQDGTRISGLLAGPPTFHGHLWVLADGTGLHAPPGQLVREPGTGQVCCHLCGRWFVALGSHVRQHGYTAAEYREAMGLGRGRALVAADLSGSIRARQTWAYRESPTTRRHLAGGQALARDGRLAAEALRSNTARDDRLERSWTRVEQLAAGRQTQARRRNERLASRLNSLGAIDLVTYLRDAYAAGAGLEDLARATGLGRSRLRAALVDAGVTVRGTGTNTLAGKRARAEAAEAEAAARVGTDDLAAWLRQRRAAGWTLTRLGAAVGHSTHWVRRRLPALEGAS